MGPSIHYSAGFNLSASLQKMIEKVIDIAEICQWPYHILYNKKFAKSGPNVLYDDQIYGVRFTPPGCETISLCFYQPRK